MKKIVYTTLLLIIAIVSVQCKSTVPLPPANVEMGADNQRCQVKISMDTCRDTLIRKDVYDSLQNAIIDSREDYRVQTSEMGTLKRRIDELKIDEFLNIKDTTIFGSKFIEVKESNLHARNRSYYRLIKKIHNLNCILNQRNRTSLTDGEILKRAKINSERASAVIDSIIETDSETISWLSDSQVEYYRQLIKQYNDLVEALK